MANSSQRVRVRSHQRLPWHLTLNKSWRCACPSSSRSLRISLIFLSFHSTLATWSPGIPLLCDRGPCLGVSALLLSSLQAWGHPHSLPPLLQISAQSSPPQSDFPETFCVKQPPTIFKPPDFTAGPPPAVLCVCFCVAINCSCLPPAPSRVNSTAAGMVICIPSTQDNDRHTTDDRSICAERMNEYELMESSQ